MSSAKTLWIGLVVGALVAAVGAFVAWSSYQHLDDTNIHFGPAIEMVGGFALILLGFGVAAACALAAVFTEAWEKDRR